MLLEIDPDTFCGEYIADGGSLPSGDRNEDWDAEKLRELFRTDDSAYSLMQNAEAEYWRNVGMRDDIEQMQKRAKAATAPIYQIRGTLREGHPWSDVDVEGYEIALKRKNREGRIVYAAPVAPAATAPSAKWSKEPPSKQGLYWHWSGDLDARPIPLSVVWSGFSGKCFVSIGQYGITQAIDCDEYGGYWQPAIEPAMDEEIGHHGSDA
ncbi:hypothetical protein [Paraburkholderia sp. CNPSo 3076]|uniref:hypothetical protein n=1 Tax=Paraburkholderia sp. CNPSo 3076 TaxID=2940936 RepID=UPI00224E6840|nr:hypothetical protein [Paraburkholderia sp. CNPSo 3076]